MNCKGARKLLRGTGLSAVLLVLMVSEEQLSKDAIKREEKRNENHQVQPKP